MTGKATEDYLEAILNSLEKRGHAKTSEIAEDLNIKSPSVTEMFQRLEERGLVDYQKYKGATLTERGRKIAKTVRSSHEVLKDFFQYLGVPEDLADKDACRVEHNISRETASQLKRFVKFIEDSSKGRPEWVEGFYRYCSGEDIPINNEIIEDRDEN